MDVVHAGIALIGAEARHALLGAAKKGTEELVQMGDEEVLVGLLVVGGLVLHEGLSGTTVKEVDGDTLVTTSVGGGKVASEVGEQVDLLALDLALSQDTGNLDADIGHGVVADDNSVDDEGQEGSLVLSSDLLEKSLWNRC